MNLQKVLRTARVMSWTYRLLSTAVGLVTVRLINDRIGIAGYGDVAFLLAFMTGVGAIDLGFLQSLSRFVASHSAEDDRQRGQFWASCALILAGLCALQMMLMVALCIALGFGGQLRALALGEVLMIGTLILAGNLMTAASAVYAGWQRYGMSSFAKIGRSLAYLGAIVTLWSLDGLSVRTVLWSNALAALLPNLLVASILFWRSRTALRWSWQGYPSAHREQLREISSYSLRGWLFTASTILVSSGTVFVAGLIMPAATAAKLQIAIVLYTGVAAFVTGAMVPLTTIRARFGDASPDSVGKVARTAHSLVEETIVLTAILLSFFLHYLGTVLALLLGDQARDPALLSLTRQVVAIALLPGLAILPWFTFRFALVGHDENALYSRRLFIGTIIALCAGSAVAWLTGSPLAMAAGVAAALVYRGTLAYRLGHGVLPGLRATGILVPLAVALAVCTALSWLANQVAPGWRLGELGDAHLQAALYLLACSVLYLLRSRLRPLLGVRLADATSPRSPT